jgi:iron complex outermembrane recepter protein
MNKPLEYMSVRASIAAILGTAALMAYSPGGLSAEQAVDGLEEVTVTGSRITRRDAEANSPLVTVDAAALENRAGLNIESYLNQLPNFNPAASPTTTQGDVQISAVNSVGISSISLRGLGANRSLTLVDGRRAVPTNALMVVDINGIPSSMISGIEIISGGASATYGADAMGGVSNFKLRRNFQGLELDAQYGITEVGDGQEIRASAILGSDFAEGRGNVVFATEYYEREAAYNKNRDFYTDGWEDPTVGGNFIGFIFGANGWNMLFNPANTGTLDAVMVAQGRPANANTGVVTFNSGGIFNGLRFTNGGKIFNPAGNNAWSWGGPIDGQQYGYVNAYDNTKCNSINTTTCPAGAGPVIQQLKYNEVEGYTSAPQTRYSFMAAGDYDITDKLRFQSSARFAQSKTRTFLAGTNASYGWEATIPYNATYDSPVNPTLNYRDPAVVAAVMANPGAYPNTSFIPHTTKDPDGTGPLLGAQHPVTTQMAILLNSRNGAPLTSGWVLETYPLNSFGRRATLNTNQVWQIEAGLTYELPVKDWTSELYYSRGEAQTYNVAFGNNSLARWRGMVTSNDYGYNTKLQSNSNGASPNFGSVAVPCTSGFYEMVFNADTPPSDDCKYAVEAPLQTSTMNQQDILELNFQGGLFELPAGEVRAALGYQYRRNSAQFNPDILQSTASFTDQVIGVYPTGYLDEQTKVRDYFAEVLVPVFNDFVINKFELELGIRYSDYDSTESTTTYKINGNIEINDWMRLRGGYNRATRAPNLGERYLPLQQIFTGGATFGDSCSLLSNSPFGAGGALGPNGVVNPPGTPSPVAPGQTLEGAQSALRICQALMGPTAAAYFYGPTNAQSAAGAGAFAWVNQIGNPNLDSEVSDTWTAGIVFRSVSGNPWVRGLTATVDWYKIDIEDAILPYSLDYAAWSCFGAVYAADTAQAQAQASTTACQNVPRNQGTGGAVSTLVSYDNQATIATSGVDFTATWVAQLEDLGWNVPGGVMLNITGTWLDYYETKTSPASYDPVIDWKGSLGPALAGFNGGAYDFRLITSLGYNLPSFGANLRWRHLPSVVGTAKAIENARIRNNEAVAADPSAGIILGYTPTTAIDADSYDVFDFSGYWTINDTLSLRFGINNLFDTPPVITGASAGRPLGSDMNPCKGAPGCINPTTYSLPNSGQGTTSGGFYDVLGRTYFVGLKAQF